MNQVIVRGVFSTGTTIDDPEVASQEVLKLLRQYLKSVSCLDPNQVFSFTVEAVESMKI